MNRHIKKYSMAEKQKIKGMLCDAIRVLCQNTIFHNTKLSIEALVGITVDNGEDTLIISIEEHIGKQASTAAASGAAEQNDYVSPNEFDQAEEFAEDGEWAEDNEEQGGDEYYGDQEADDVQMVGSDGAIHDNGNYVQQFGVTVKQESTSLVAYNCSAAGSQVVKTENLYNEQNDQFYDDESAYFDEYGAQFGGDASATQFAQNAAQTPKRRRPPPANPRRSATKSPRVTPQKKRPAPATVASGTGPQNFSTDEQSTTTEGGGSRSRVIDNEVATVTLFTCSICGIQLRNRWSFVRHKQTHEGIFYRCDACGKMISRKDHLLAHKRRCQAALQRQEQQQEVS